MRALICCMVVAAGIQITSAEMTATTESGKKVVLQDNGTWRFSETDASAAPSALDKETSNSDNSRVRLVELIKNDARYDFRKVRWGMTKKEVIGIEDAKLVKNSGDTLIYEMQFLGYNCSVLYRFTKEVLWSALFLIQQPHVDPALFFRDYDELKKYLTPLYGNALSDKYDWKNEIYKTDKSKWGFAVSIGFLVCRTEWHNNRTRIELKITGGNHQISTDIEYSSLVK